MISFKPVRNIVSLGQTRSFHSVICSLSFQLCEIRERFSLNKDGQTFHSLHFSVHGDGLVCDPSEWNAQTKIPSSLNKNFHFNIWCRWMLLPQMTQSNYPWTLNLTVSVVTDTSNSLNWYVECIIAIKCGFHSYRK